MMRRRYPILFSVVLLAGGCAGPQVAPTPTSPAESPTPAAEPTSSSTPVATVSQQPTPRAEAGWMELEARGPTGREDHTWTVASDGVAYLFGGRSADNQTFDDVWAYDLARDTWQALDPPGPRPAAPVGHQAVWVDGIGLVVFAGQRGTDFFNDLWAYDPQANAWEELPAGGSVPVARYGTCAAIGPDGRLWVSHGFTADQARFRDTLAYDFELGEWTDETPPGATPVERCLHGCWWNDDRDAFVLYAGQTTGVTALADLWHLGAEQAGAVTWTRIESDLPPDRNLYAFARWQEGTIVFGGQGADGYRTDVWRLADDGSAAELALAAGPAGRAGATLIADTDRGRLLLFGGRDATEAFADTWQLTPPG